MTADVPTLPYRVSVRELCAFTAKSGDLDLRFTPAPTALEGQIGHAKVMARRGPGYERERALAGTFGLLHIRGRADGYWPDRHELEEIKTHRGSLDRIPENHRALHWAQLKLYGALLCREQSLPELRLTLVYFDIVRERETRVSEVHDAASLEAFLASQAQRFLDWALRQRAHRQRRDAALAGLTFPFPEMHAGQRTLAEAVYRRCRDGGTLLAQAPTGIGKTLGTLFPALKAAAGGVLDRLFYLTAKTSGRQPALDAMRQLSAGIVATTAADGPAIRVLELTARDKACEHPDKACHGDSCPLARGFYDRLHAARVAALDAPVLDQSTLRTLAREHAVCPYYLGQEMARWSDVIIGDVHYYFDLGALLHALTQAGEWRVAVLVDEAHNLLERGRAMYSAELDPVRLTLARRHAPRTLKRHLTAVACAWAAVHAAQTVPYRVHEQLPAALGDALGQFSTALTDAIGDQPDSVPEALQAFHFDALQWRGLAEHFGPHSLFDVSLRPDGQAALCLRNVVPAPFLAERLAAAHTAVLFSATLTPPALYRDLLGLPDDTVTLDVPAPFRAEQLQVRIASRISTRYAERAASIDPISTLIAGQYSRQPGNYLAFFSSFDYLGAVLQHFRQQHPDVPVWQQQRGMPEAERQAFLERFEPQGRGIGFAVLGGAFAEGVDLPGSRLIGAFVATLGLPQVNPVNEEFRRRLDTLFGAGRGYDLFYLYPGLQKVVQACGRVIRTPEDRGTVMLIDDRYARPSIRALLPRWWQIRPL